ncbi:MAG: hydroxyacylglutathione hydrolase [Methylophaga sp.]|nr:hydroxyacylglutathione hydrolase [Methylophaga sp.]
MSVHAVAAFHDNYIWLIQSAQRRRVLIVDPGDAEPVLTALQKWDLTPAAILITHHHHDHTGGIAALKRQFNIPVYGPAAEQISDLTVTINAGEALKLDPDFTEITVLDTGGHTLGHISYLISDQLFCGDTLFAGGCGRLLGGTAAQLFASLKQIAELPDTTNIYCAHEYTLANLQFALAVEPGNAALQQRFSDTKIMRAQNQPTVPSTLALEKATNPFLRCAEPTIKQAAEQQAGQSLDSPLAVFKVLRQWKDNFTAA